MFLVNACSYFVFFATPFLQHAVFVFVLKKQTNIRLFVKTYVWVLHFANKPLLIKNLNHGHDSPLPHFASFDKNHSRGN